MSKSTFTIGALALLLGALGSGCSDDGTAPTKPAPEAAAADTPNPAEASPAAVPPPPTGQRQPTSLFDSRVPEDDPIAVVLAESDPFTRIAELASLLSTLGPEGVASARFLLNGLNDGSQEFGVAECSLLIQFWSRHDPEASARWSLYSSPRAYRSSVVVPAVVVWAKQDPETVAGVVREFVSQPGLYTELAEVALLWGWFDSGKPGLTDYIRNLGAGYSRQRLLAAFAKRTTERDGPEAAIRFAEGIGDEHEKFKLAAHRQTARVLARTHPTVAAAWCDEQCDGPYGDSVPNMISQHWAAMDGEAAMAWVAGMPPGQQRNKAVKGALRGWWPIDREAFHRWASEMERSGVPDWFQPAVELYAAGLARWKRPEEGLAWAARIEDEATRHRTTLNVARIWHNMDKEPAEAWLLASSLSEEDRESVRNPISGRGFRTVPSPDES